MSRYKIKVSSAIQEITVNSSVVIFLISAFSYPSIPGMRIRFWPRKRIRGSLPQTNGDFKKSIEKIFQKILKAFFFVFILLVSDVPQMCQIQKTKIIETKKKALKVILTYSFNRLLKISLSLRYRAPDSFSRPKPDPHPWNAWIGKS